MEDLERKFFGFDDDYLKDFLIGKEKKIGRLKKCVLDTQKFIWNLKMELDRRTKIK